MAMGHDITQLSYVGVVGVWDPPRVGVAESVRVLQESGVEIKMITGDAMETGEAIGVWHVHLILTIRCVTHCYILLHHIDVVTSCYMCMYVY